ncbi:Periplasmic serine protease (ClpP class) [Halanaeroarchaeum sp. HSR-CO]|uniref:signal peptide peptidase SppA n=1 Tax=Halanaeroarchaeum sp. HSR-CO TaxID=2866382 RepID=UPI00217EC347|nr:signal peptide peptidase SppA [Halanaeroarchaeum sp. HSR-CO]UWG47320.1 Periplasmic serine protease (ClpP class) [Halanaeroarchaeum sp. HSR-CO]
MSSTASRLARVLIAVVAAVVAAALGYLVFVDLPGGSLARLLGVLLTIGVAILGIRMARRYSEHRFAPYNVGQVSVEGPIARRPGRSLSTPPVMVTADDIVEQIEAADADDAVRALVVHLDTPGGEVVPSDDIRRAVEDFDGPTVAYATDTCASGGYWIASGCDHIVAREGSIVGSIGVIASRVTGEGLLERLGLTYERLVAGDYKDAGVALRDMDDDEREYLQGIVDDYYQTFVDRVVSGRDLDEDDVMDTQARVFLGEDALERGLVDDIGAADTVEEWIEAELDEAVTIREFEPQIGFADRIGMGAERVAFALGAGLSSVLVDDGDGATDFEFR